MSAARYLARAANVAARMIGGEMMIMSGRDSSLFSLNETASTLWQAADGMTTVDQIARAICREFEVDPDTALRDLQEVAQALAGHGILVFSDTPIPDADAAAMQVAP
jgi:hypothetical protein